MVTTTATQRDKSTGEANLSKEQEASLELYHTPSRVACLIGGGYALIAFSFFRLCRVALGVETAAGACGATQVFLFVFYLLLGLTLLTLFNKNTTKRQPTPEAVWNASVVVLLLLLIVFQIFIASLLSQDDPQPPEVWLFIGVVLAWFQFVPSSLMLGHRVSMFSFIIMSPRLQSHT